MHAPLVRSVETAMQLACAIQPGDSVQLWTGGPWMTVQSLVRDQSEELMVQRTGTPTPYRYALCSWFDQEQQFHTETFCLAGLGKGRGPAQRQPQAKDTC